MEYIVKKQSGEIVKTFASITEAYLTQTKTLSTRIIDSEAVF